MSGNEVTIRVTGRNDSGPATTAAKKEIGELTKQTEFFGKKAAEARVRVDELMQSLLEVGHDGSKSIEQITVEEKKLIAELEKAQAELSRFERHGKNAADKIARALKEAAEAAAEAAAQQGFHAGDVFTEGMLSSFSAAKPALIGGLVALGVMATPTIGAMIGGAVLGGVGMGGMIGGIALAARDPRVKQAAEEFASNAMPNLDRLGSPFVEPVVGALDRLDEKFRHMSMGPLQTAFEDLSREVAPFTLNLERAADKFLPGFTRALKAAEPVLRTIGDELPGFAADITAMFDAMSEDPDGAVMGMKKLIDVTGDVLVLFGELVGWMEQTYEGGVAIGLVMSAVFKEWFHWLAIIFPPFELLARWMGILNEDLEGQADALGRANSEAPEFGGNLTKIQTAGEKAAEALSNFNEVIDTMLGKQLDFDQLQSKWAQGMRDLRKELLEGTRTLSLNTEEGTKNRDAILGQLAVAIKMRDEEAQRTGDMAAADAQFERRIDLIAEQGRKAGIAKGELDALLDAYRGGSAKVQLEFIFAGLLEGLSQMERAIRLRGVLADFGSASTSWSSQRNDERRGMASGGIASGGWTPINEQGWEMVKLPSGATVIPHGTSQAMLSGASGGSSQPILVQLTLPGGDVWREVLIDDALTRGVDSTTVAGAYP